MDTDYALVMGLIIAVMGVPSVLGAAVDGRAPRMGIIMVVISGGLIAYAVTERPGGYGANDVQRAFTRVVSELVN